MDRPGAAHDLYLVLERFRPRYAHHQAAFSQLRAADSGLGVVCSYCSETDIALVAVRQVDDAPASHGLSSVIAAARRANAAILDPERLSFTDRRSFYEQYLPRYDHRGERCASVPEALEAMAAQLEIVRGTPASGPQYPRATGSETGARRVRGASRFPIRWPVTLIAGPTTRMTLSARDISRTGMFIASVHALRTRDVAFVIPPDAGGRPIAGRARIVREVDAPTAHDLRVDRGIGIEIIHMRTQDDSRLEQFIERVARRSASRILVGAVAGRGGAIARDLTAAGYAVVATDSADDVMRAAAEPRPYDLVILDDALTNNISDRQRLRRLFAGRIPCVALPAARPAPTRAAIDLLLRIVTLR